jgi:hypothetical protein
MKNFMRVLFIVLLFFPIVFGSYQLFIDKVDAALFRCNWDQKCSSSGDDCSDSISYSCQDFFGVGHSTCLIDFAPIE